MKGTTGRKHFFVYCWKHEISPWKSNALSLNGPSDQDLHRLSLLNTRNSFFPRLMKWQ